MNLKRIDYSNYNQNEFNITPYWLLGFVEAEGTFGIKNLTPYFQVAQNGKSKNLMEAIKIYLSKIQLDNLSTSIKPSLVTNKSTCPRAIARGLVTRGRGVLIITRDN